MRQLFKISAFLIAATFIMTGSALATKPDEDVNPNGFPSGPHYNLNIHGKKAEFNCPEQEYYLEITGCPVVGCGIYSQNELVKDCPDGYTCDSTDIPIYGNSIFVPEDGQGIEIYMQSGKKGGKGKKADALPQDELWAIDPCAVFDGDGAVIQLPPGKYDVYARALAKPTYNPDMTVTPQLFAVEDANGNDLIWLGLLTDNGFATPSQTFTRRKGNSVAIPITGLFEWTGEVCYFDDLGDPSAFDYSQENCCMDYEPDGIFDYCCYAEDGNYTIDTCSGDLSGFIYGDCTILTTYCNSYTQEWVFNIADFVTYLWDTDNNGLKLLQVRFYPR
jgi:hypothetical protein